MEINILIKPLQKFLHKGVYLMENVFNNMGTIVGFLIIVFLIQSFGGENVSSKTVLFILFSMVILNANKLKNALDGAFVSEKE